MGRNWWIILCLLAVGHVLFLGLHMDEDLLDISRVESTADQVRSAHAPATLTIFEAHPNSTHQDAHGLHHCSSCQLSLLPPESFYDSSFGYVVLFSLKKSPPSPIASDGINRPPIRS